MSTETGSADDQKNTATGEVDEANNSTTTSSGESDKAESKSEAKYTTPELKKIISREVARINKEHAAEKAVLEARIAEFEGNVDKAEKQADPSQSKPDAKTEGEKTWKATFDKERNRASELEKELNQLKAEKLANTVRDKLYEHMPDGLNEFQKRTVFKLVNDSGSMHFDDNGEVYFKEGETPMALVDGKPDYAGVVRRFTENLFPNTGKKGFDAVNIDNNGAPIQATSDKKAGNLQEEMKTDPILNQAWVSLRQETAGQNLPMVKDEVVRARAKEFRENMQRPQRQGIGAGPFGR